jgi:hypothetical protein
MLLLENSSFLVPPNFDLQTQQAHRLAVIANENLRPLLRLSIAVSMQ